MVSRAATIFDHPMVYRFWQAPFANKKLEPIFHHNDMSTVRKVLDVGCGPGTNTSHFKGVDYLGIDLNERYVESARRCYQREFICADVMKYSAKCTQSFDFILVNSILHHFDKPVALQLLSQLERLLTENGHIHVLELVKPARLGMAKLLAQWDRGKYALPLSDWWGMFSKVFKIVVFEPYKLKAFRTTLWEMVYLKGRANR